MGVAAHSVVPFVPFFAPDASYLMVLSHPDFLTLLVADCADRFLSSRLLFSNSEEWRRSAAHFFVQSTDTSLSSTAFCWTLRTSSCIRVGVVLRWSGGDGTATALAKNL